MQRNGLKCCARPHASPSRTRAVACTRKATKPWSLHKGWAWPRTRAATYSGPQARHSRHQVQRSCPPALRRPEPKAPQQPAAPSCPLAAAFRGPVTARAVHAHGDAVVLLQGPRQRVSRCASRLRALLRGLPAAPSPPRAQHERAEPHSLGCTDRHGSVLHVQVPLTWIMCHSSNSSKISSRSMRARSAGSRCAWQGRQGTRGAVAKGTCARRLSVRRTGAGNQRTRSQQAGERGPRYQSLLHAAAPQGQSLLPVSTRRTRS